ncbi:DUF3551 domain-containing protein [Bradyrhizobium sp. LA6.12]|uniref:DUF3551 domain-containing protein n=1 Tax=unclassified Bradyrhizobium TaxID=2631580 RepID=UPI003390B83F
MRRARFALVAIGLLFSGVLADAQTYDPSYPVCMQIYGPVGYFDCRYTSLEQCKFLAVGRSASCTVNPYFAEKRSKAPRRPKQAD